MKTNIVIIGFFNTGKTAVGRKLAVKLGKDFIDIDELIAVKTGKSPGEIVMEEGEIVFREHEIERIKSVSGAENAVISCGGGAIVNRINIDRLKQNGIIVLLTAPLETIIERTATQNKRPIIHRGDPRTELIRLWEERSCLWGPAADIVIDTSDKSVEAIVDEIANLLQASQ